MQYQHDRQARQNQNREHQPLRNQYYGETLPIHKDPSVMITSKGASHGQKPERIASSYEGSNEPIKDSKYLYNGKNTRNQNDRLFHSASKTPNQNSDQPYLNENNSTKQSLTIKNAGTYPLSKSSDIMSNLLLGK